MPADTGNRAFADGVEAKAIDGADRSRRLYDVRFSGATCEALPDGAAEGDLTRFLRDLLAPGLAARGVGPVTTAG